MARRRRGGWPSTLAGSLRTLLIELSIVAFLAAAAGGVAALVLALAG